MKKRVKQSKKPASIPGKPVAEATIPVPPAKAKPLAPAYRAAGYNEEGVDAYIKAAEDKDRGTTRFPWPDAFKTKLKAELNGLDTVDQMKDKLNTVVVASLGGGLHNRGPLA
jgi:hypothetical protein